jgi:hypothetical protein
LSSFTKDFPHSRDLKIKVSLGVIEYVPNVNIRNMKLYRYSPIKSEQKLRDAIEYMHFESFRLCKNSFGKHLPVAGNVGVFCHYDEEYEELVKIREELTEDSDNWNQKYYKLHSPITILAKDEIPETTYTYLYIRKPDPYRHHIGDIDFVLGVDEYEKL